MNIPFERLAASRYAGSLREAVRDEEPYKLLDMLLVGALIEARSCERFAVLAPHLPKRLGKYSMKWSGRPHPRRNGSGRGPDFWRVRTSILLGP